MIFSSIIIPTFNRAASLQHTLTSLLQLSIGAERFEVIVIDNGSTDSTNQVVLEVIEKHPLHQVRYIYDPEPGLLTGRHRGALEARGELLTFVDDDIVATPDWLTAIVQTFEDSSVQLVGGRNLPRYEGPPPPWLKGFWWIPPSGGQACGSLSLLNMGDAQRDIDANYIWGLNFSIRQQALFDLGGFHPDCIPEALQHFQGDGETGLTIQATERGYRAVYQPAAIVYHCVPAGRLTPEYFQRRAYFQGVCDSYTTMRRQGGLAPPVPEQPPTEESGLHRLGRYARHPLLHSCNLVRRLFPKPKPLPPVAIVEEAELNQIRHGVESAYRSGYAFHQHAVRDMPGLIDWVLREDYWDYRLPKLAGPPPSQSQGQSS